MGCIYRSNGNLEFYLKFSDIEKLNNKIFITGYPKDEFGKETEIFYAIKLDRDLRIEPEDWNFMRHQKIIISLNMACLEEIVKKEKFQFSLENKKITFCYSKPNEVKYY